MHSRMEINVYIYIYTKNIKKDIHTHREKISEIGNHSNTHKKNPIKYKN